MRGLLLLWLCALLWTVAVGIDIDGYFVQTKHSCPFKLTIEEYQFPPEQTEAFRNVTVIPPILEPPSNQRFAQNDPLIPRVIVTTHQYEQVPFTLNRNWQHVRNRNPFVTMRYYSESHAKAFLQAHFDEEINAAYDSLGLHAMRSEFFRLCFLTLNGGIAIAPEVSVDVDLLEILLSSFLESRRRSLIVVQDEETKTIEPRLMAAKPGHPYLKLTIRRMAQLILGRNRGVDPRGITGGAVLAETFEAIFGITSLVSATLLPRSVLVLQQRFKLGCAIGEIVLRGFVDRTIAFTSYPEYMQEMRWYAPQYVSETLEHAWRTDTLFR